MDRSEEGKSNSNLIDEASLRKLITSIYANPDLTSLEKAQQIQNLMSSRWKQSTGPSLLSASASVDMLAQQINQTSSMASFRKQDVLGCVHYQTRCRVGGDCCQPFFPCRICHDEQADHELARNKISRIQCMTCGNIQGIIPDKCENCDTLFARYHCSKCGLFDDDPQRKIFHCNDCGICRKGSVDAYQHCKKCNACVHKDYYPKHKCIERSLECDCPICGEYLFTSRKPTIFMTCGHSIHRHCYSQYIQNSYSCPICMKSIGNVMYYFAQLDMIMAEHQMPEEYSNKYSQVLCNDCEKKSWAKFHFMYHKCGECGSFNTKVVNTMTVEDGMESPLIKNVTYSSPSNN